MDDVLQLRRSLHGHQSACEKNASLSNFDNTLRISYSTRDSGELEPVQVTSLRNISSRRSQSSEPHACFWAGYMTSFRQARQARH